MGIECAGEVIRPIPISYAVGLLLIGTLAVAQPLPDAPFSLDAETVTMREIDGQMEVEATGGITFEQEGRTIGATGASLRLARPNGSTSTTSWTPSALSVYGRVTYSAPTGDRGSAGGAAFDFAMGRLDLRGGTQWTHGTTVIKASTTTITEEGDLVVAEGTVSASLADVQVLDFGSADQTLVSCTRATWRAPDNAITASGEPVVVKQGGITLESSSISFRVPGGTLASLEAQDGVVVYGDLEGRGQQMRLEAASASYDPATQVLTLGGPVVMVREGSRGTATSAELRQNPRSVRLYGLQGGVSVGGPVAP